MALQKVRWTAEGTWRVFQGGREAPDVFVSGETMPQYELKSDFSGNKNVGNIPGVTLTLYGGTQGTGILTLSDAGAVYDNIDFGNRMLDIRENCTFNNCRGVLTNITSTAQGEQIRLLNGNFTSVTFNDCEFHNRAQFIVNGINGRNFTVNRCILTGQVDGINNSNGGAAPVVTGGVVNDSWVGDHAWWAATGGTNGIVHPNDDQTHNDTSQTAFANMKWNNVFFGCWPSEWVGTGTPNAGSDTGNPHTATYIYTQSTQDGLRSSLLNVTTRADQSFNGVSRKSCTGGSFAGIMGTLSAGGALNHEVDHCWFSGGTVHINYSATNLSGNAGFIHRSTFWNDMSAGHTHPTTVKGTAVYVKSGLTLDMPTTVGGADTNYWFDGTVVSPVFV